MYVHVWYKYTTYEYTNAQFRNGLELLQMQNKIFNMALALSMNTSKEFISFTKNKTIYRPPSDAKVVISQILFFSTSPEDIHVLLLSTKIYWNAPVIIHSSYKLQTSCNKKNKLLIYLKICVIRSKVSSLLNSQNQRIIKVGKNLQYHLVQLSSYHQYCPVNHIPQQIHLIN